MNISSWQSKKMRDYTQHLKMNCGGVASVFALYGLNETVPRNIVDEYLVQENVSASKIEQNINEVHKPGINAKEYGHGAPIKINGKYERIGCLERFSSSSVEEEALKDILISYNARCIIVSCWVRGAKEWRDSWLIHWQTCYIDLFTNKFKWYNNWPQWRIAIEKAPLGTPTGLIMVEGPKIIVSQYTSQKISNMKKHLLK